VQFTRRLEICAVKSPQHLIRAGDVVRVRRERWRVVGVRGADGRHQIVTLAGHGRSNAGVVRSVITPFDLIEAAAPGRVRRVSLLRWRHLCRALLLEQARYASPASLTTAAGARIDLHAFQLEPALAVVSGRGTRVLLADEVGLGKTVQAGLIVSELRARGGADRVLVLAPAGVREQWVRELADRFQLEAVVMDTREGRRRAAALPPGVNPWTTVPFAVSSIDYVKRPEVLALVRAAAWDVVVVDEAHGAAAARDRHSAVSALCRRAAYVVLMTATPHNGDGDAFRALCELGTLDRDPLVIFRRRRGEVGVGAGRRIHCLSVRASESERAMHDALRTLAQAVSAEGRGRLDARLAMSVLYKRACSSAYALRTSAARRLSALPSTGGVAERQLALPLDDPTGDLDASDSAPQLSVPLLEHEECERTLLEDIRDRASAAELDQRKLRALMRLIRRLDTRGERAVVFTEFRDTLLHVRDALGPAAVIHGGLTPAERQAGVDAFVSGDARLLLATDAAGEGLNLHHTCRVVVNLELPWNPVRLEQRIGRVDRIGQTRRVHVFHLIARDTVETSVAARLQSRVMHADAAVGFCDPLGFVEASHTVPPVAGVRLQRQAAAERERLRSVRDTHVFESRSSVVPLASGDVFVASSRRRARLRRALKSKCLGILRASLDVDTGRACAVQVSAVTFELASGNRSADAESVASAVNLLDVSGAPMDAWREESERDHKAFWRRRTGRERAMASAQLSGAESVQAGLFDRRAERGSEDARARREASTATSDSRIAASERASILEWASPRVRLLLLA
jgi:superfamily II DNA or RNA helicase